MKRAVLLFCLAICVLGTFGQMQTAIDLNWNNQGQGFVSLPATTIGSSGSFSFEVQIARRSGGSRPSQASVVYMGRQDRAANYDFEITVDSSNRIGVRIGSVFRVSSLAVNIESTWAYIAVVVTNSGSSSSVRLFINGVDQTATLPSSSFPLLIAGQRNRNFIGFSDNFTGFNGFVDTLVMWNLALAPSVIQRHAGFRGTDFDVDTTGLIVHYNFNEGFGSVSYGVPGDSAEEAYTAVLKTPQATFGNRFEQGWKKCEGTGDPHFVSVANQYFDTPHVEGFWVFATCGNGDGKYAFTIQNYHATGCCWGRATVIRAINVRLGNTVFQYAGTDVAGSTIAGPYAFKVVPPGVDAATVGWTQMSPTSRVFDNGLTVKFNSPTSIEVYGPPFGYITFVDHGSYINAYVRLSATCANNQGKAVCSGHSVPIDRWTFNNPITPVALPPLPDAAPISDDPCQGVSAELKALAVKTCTRLFGGPGNNGYPECLFDTCATGEPPVPPPCKPGEVCCKCSAFGTCNPTTGACTCDAGFGGPDCSSRLVHHNLTLTTGAIYDSLPYTLTSFDLGASVASGLKPNPAVSALIDANKWSVKNSLLVYVGSVKRLDASGAPFTDNHLYVINDANNAETPVTMTINVVTGLPAPTPIGKGTSTGSGSISLRTFPVSQSGVIYPYLPDNWCVEMTTSFDGQVLIGSGNARGQLDVIRAPRIGANTNFKICGNKINNPCAAITDCPTCAANSQCGWCRTSGTCRLGRPSGPIDGTSCPAWAFSFDSVNRRITQKYGYPVNPIKTTVVLAGSVDLPIELTVDMGYRIGATWDVALFWPTASTDGGLLTVLKNQLSGLGLFLHNTYSNIGLALATYSYRAGATPEANGDKNAYNLIFGLASPSDAATLSSLASRVSLNPNSNPGTRTILSALARGGATQHPGWRLNTRHLAVVFVNEVNGESGVALAAAKNALIAQNVFPVFAVLKSSVKASYQQLTRDIGFGLVIDVSSGNVNLINVLTRVLDDASGAIGALTPDGDAGRVDTAVLNKDTLTVSGLMSGMRSRIVFPLDPAVGNSEVTTIVAPGFGTATIEAIPSDSPYTNGVPLRIKVDPPFLPYSQSLTGSLVFFTGKPADVLNSQATVAATVVSYNEAKGTLYQFNADLLATATEISTAAGFVKISSGVVGGVRVTDVQGRAIYVPVDNAWGNAASVAYDTFTYFVTDQCSSSPNGPLDVFVAYANNESPTAAMVAQKTKENQALRIKLAGADTRQHELTATITKFETSIHTPLLGKLYAFSQACWTAVSANFENVAACTAVTLPFTTDSQREIIYVPYKYANSEAKPAVYEVQPRIQYHVTQIKNAFDAGLEQQVPPIPFVPLESESVWFDIKVAAVNQAPTVTVGPHPWLSFPSNYEAPAPSACVSTCNWDQNLGVEFPDRPAPAPVYLGGADIESEQLTVKILSASCSDQFAWLNDTRTYTPVQTGNVLAPFPAYSYQPLLSFLPTSDGFGDAYCRVVYKVTDEEGLDSPDTATIVINIKEVPLPPRSLPVTVYAPRRLPQNYTFTAWGVGNGIGIDSGSITACEGDKTSVITIGSITVDCDSLPQAIGAPATVEAYTNGAFKATWNGVWTPAATESEDGTGRVLTLSFLDTHEPKLSSSPVAHRFVYRAVNFGPELYFLESDKPGFYVERNYTLSVIGDKDSASRDLRFNATDDDSGDLGVFATVTLTGGDADASLFIPSGIAGVTFLPANATVTRKITVEGNIAHINEVLRLLAFNGPAKEETYTVFVEVSDMGHQGACTPEIPEPCAKYARSWVTLNVVPNNSITGGIIAGAAGGAVLAAVAAAAVAWRKLRTPPTEGYNPWEMDDNTEGAMMNPLFEDAGRTGDNAIYEPGN